ncbi:hypothetical protein [Saccharibacillus deserti]|nr:hypothetical protein [Saccharibacillus deserti]
MTDFYRWIIGTHIDTLNQAERSEVSGLHVMPVSEWLKQPSIASAFRG